MKDNRYHWLYRRDYKTSKELCEAIKRLEDEGKLVMVDDNWSIIYQTRVPVPVTIPVTPN